jgi:hypothetical protein
MQDDMLDRFMRSCRLVKASWDVLRSDRELLLLPILSVLAMVLALLMWVISIRAVGISVPKTHHVDLLRVAQDDPVLFASFFFAYLFIYFFGFFFNTALVGAALESLEGGNPTVGSALALAFQRVGPIFGYALVSATVGVLMAIIIERVGGIIGRLLGIGFGFAWTIATFLVVPILAAQGVGPITAIAESAGLVRKTWGENLIGNVGISLAMSAVGAIIMIFGFVGGLALSQRGHPELFAPILAGTVFLFLVSALVGSALRGIYVAAVYYYAVAGEPPWGFSQDALRGAFRAKAQ